MMHTVIRWYPRHAEILEQTPGQGRTLVQSVPYRPERVPDIDNIRLIAERIAGNKRIVSEHAATT